MKRVWVILAAAALLLWLSLMHSRGKGPDVNAFPSAHDLAAKNEPTAAAPAAAPPDSAPVAKPSPQPAQPSEPAVQHAAPVQSAAAVPASGSDLIPLPPRHDRPRFTPAEARAGSPGKILGRAFAREKPDPTWSPGAEADIRKITSGAELVGQELLGVECRGSICKLQMRYQLRDRDKFDAMFGKLHDRFGTEPGIDPVSQMDNHGQQLLRVYVMREGKAIRDYPH